MFPIPANDLSLDEFELADNRLTGRVEAILGSSGYIELRGLKVTAHDGRVLLRGKLPSYFLRQMACSLVREIGGVTAIDDELLVAVIPR